MSRPLPGLCFPVLPCPSLAGVAAHCKRQTFTKSREIFWKRVRFSNYSPSASRSADDLLAQLGELGFEAVEPVAREAGGLLRRRSAAGLGGAGRARAARRRRAAARSAPPSAPGGAGGGRPGSRSTSRSRVSWTSPRLGEGVEPLAALLQLARGLRRRAASGPPAARARPASTPEGLVEQVAVLARAAAGAAGQPGPAAQRQAPQGLDHRPPRRSRRPGRGSSTGCRRAAAR